jgi:hypothetical protein
MAQHQRHAVRQDQFELAAFYFGIQQIHTCGVNLDQHVVLSKLGLWHLAQPHRILAAVPIDDECFHDGFLWAAQTAARLRMLFLQDRVRGQ